MVEEQKNEKEIKTTDKAVLPKADAAQKAPTDATVTEKKVQKPVENIELIVRVADNDLDGKATVIRALTKIRGIGLRMAKNIAIVFEKETGASGNEKLGELKEEHVKKLEQIVLKPTDFNIPVWSLNRQNDFTTGENTHRIMGELEFGLRTDLQRLGEIKSYRGLRHTWKLPVRGQRNKSTHRNKGTTVGVTKKDNKK
ncbi:MAG: 30S ribosomal protein S13 [Candidatus Diapherotrites archaeon]|uniref:Small ribosomal subunit protein uS13 n=1 Tax=Candidatus Iainarchaeum sp. TaxID=3101447 RepID=A0A2D6LP96_9ARCH|nr:30S ribosomal protein S13 [Candidatus Diapherotrites archaeon]|tara:strand:+ start:9931 stop:10524 length:594 start_codon:yes stop_codon:yes gene_type:complete